jgi:hypothetical protein
MKFSGIRDIPAAIIGAVSGGIGLGGVAAKKFFISADDSFTKKFLVGLGVTVATGLTGLVPFLLAAPGQETKADLAAARQAAVDNRYNG